MTSVRNGFSWFKIIVWRSLYRQIKEKSARVNVIALVCGERVETAITATTNKHKQRK